MSGTYNKAAGNIKQTTGNKMGNERMQAEGKAQNTQGHATEMANKAKGMANRAKGTMEETMNSFTGNKSGEAEGKMKKNMGEAEQKWNS